MKLNRVSNWVYCIFMLLPFLTFGLYILMYAFNRGQLPQEISNFISFTNTFSALFDDSVFFNWMKDGNFLPIINDFIYNLGLDPANNLFIANYIAYGLYISLIYLGYEVLLAFINIARKLVYAFVDKEF